jgi:SAM-dependent methyltransferase
MASRADAELIRLRQWVASQYLSGEGIEIGALHEPLPVPPSARVRYVDRLSAEDLRSHYTELRDEPLVPVDILDDGETLATIANGSQDFVIGNHFLEHCEDPIRALRNIVRVLRTGGVAYLAIPDKRHTFDRARSTTPIQHLVEDHQRGPEHSRREHFEEWVEVMKPKASPAEKAAEVERLMSMNYSIHFHCWTQVELLELLVSVRRGLDLPFEVELLLRNGHEILAILRKGQR